MSSFHSIPHEVSCRSFVVSVCQESLCMNMKVNMYVCMKCCFMYVSCTLLHASFTYHTHTHVTRRGYEE